jgi:Cu2+-exporting ATPase
MATDALTLPTSPAVAGASAGEERGTIIVPGIHCAGCIARIERILGATPGITHARVNLTDKRVCVVWRGGEHDLEAIADIVRSAGYAARPVAGPDAAHDAAREERRRLVRALAVAGFAAGNVMLLSVSVWSGAEHATRDLLHWISALIALPAIVYAGRPFFSSAASALASWRLNMDVPISLALILAAAMSLHETVIGSERVYFDAACMLAFFLLTGRVLDQMMRARARSAVGELVALQPATAQVVDPGGARRTVPAEDLRAGMTIFLAPGQRAPVDGRITTGRSDLDQSLITGEAEPRRGRPGSAIAAGTINLTGPIEIEVTAAGAETGLAEIARLMEAAENARARYLRIADRAARIYAPLVHIAALLAFAGWLAASGDWHLALTTAIAVLIITCPCALGLAVPAVQVVACGRLFAGGVMVKNGAGLERLAEVDTVIFDKTGTLTRGAPELAATDEMAAGALAAALGLARESRHPLARALAAGLAGRGALPAPVTHVREEPGLGLEGMAGGRAVRLGSRAWCGEADDRTQTDEAGPEIWLRIAGGPARRFTFRDRLRADAGETVAALAARGLAVMLVSGDREATVRRIAAEAGITDFRWGQTPQDKAQIVTALHGAGHRVLMVGDGLNDAPALALAHASMAPSSAADIAGTAADLVFLGGRLGAVTAALDVARRARRLVRQNFALAGGYNLLAVPIAVVGLASPLVAAVAMSASSIAVTANALRLRAGRPQARAARPVEARPAAGAVARP